MFRKSYPNLCGISGLCDIFNFYLYCFGFTNFSRCRFLLQLEDVPKNCTFRSLGHCQVVTRKDTKFVKPKQYDWRMKISQRPEIPHRFDYISAGLENLPWILGEPGENNLCQFDQFWKRETTHSLLGCRSTTTNSCQITWHGLKSLPTSISRDFFIMADYVRIQKQ